MGSSEYAPPENLIDGFMSSRGQFERLILFLVVVMNIVALFCFSFSLKTQEKYHPDQHLDYTEREDLKQLGMNSNILIVKLSQTKDELKTTQRELQLVREELKITSEHLNDVGRAHVGLIRGSDQELPESQELREFMQLRKLPLGWNPSLNTDAMPGPVGHGCLIQREDIIKYMDYQLGGGCPDDGALAQKLMLEGCEPLPRRRCFSKIPSNFSHDHLHTFPQCQWELPPDDNIIWTPYECKSFDCLNTRAQRGVFADCIDCFDLKARERDRWHVSFSSEVDYTVEEVLALKAGTIRIGMDLGGGAGTFAVRMREHHVTIVTTSLNLGGPFNSFIAHRGIVPFFITISQRLPFFDNTLDIIHSMHLLSNWIPDESLEFILLDIDRILRPGGLFWLDRFFCIKSELSVYVPLIERLGYRKLKWGMSEKLDRGPELHEMYLSAVLEKPYKRS